MAGEVAARSAYGARQVRRNPVNGQAYSPIGYNAFVELALRVLQATPGATMLRAGAFGRDGVIVDWGLAE